MYVVCLNKKEYRKDGTAYISVHSEVLTLVFALTCFDHFRMNNAEDNELQKSKFILT